MTPRRVGKVRSGIIEQVSLSATGRNDVMTPRFRFALAAIVLLGAGLHLRRRTPIPSAAKRPCSRGRSCRRRGRWARTTTSGSSGRRPCKKSRPTTTRRSATATACTRRPIPTAAADGPARGTTALRQGHHHRLHALPRRLDLRQELCRPGQQLARHPGALRGAGQGDRRPRQDCLSRSATCAARPRPAPSPSICWASATPTCQCASRIGTTSTCTTTCARTRRPGGCSRRRRRCTTPAAPTPARCARSCSSC